MIIYRIMNIHIISIKSNQNLPRLNKLIEGRNRRSPEDFVFTHIREQLFRVIWSYLPLVCRTYRYISALGQIGTKTYRHWDKSATSLTNRHWKNFNVFSTFSKKNSQIPTGTSFIQKIYAPSSSLLQGKHGFFICIRNCLDRPCVTMPSWSSPLKCKVSL